MPTLVAHSVAPTNQCTSGESAGSSAREARSRARSAPPRRAVATSSDEAPTSSMRAEVGFEPGHEQQEQHADLGQQIEPGQRAQRVPAVKPDQPEIADHDAGARARRAPPAGRGARTARRRAARAPGRAPARRARRAFRPRAARRCAACLSGHSWEELVLQRRSASSASGVRRARPRSRRPGAVPAAPRSSRRRVRYSHPPGMVRLARDSRRCRMARFKRSGVRRALAALGLALVAGCSKSTPPTAPGGRYQRAGSAGVRQRSQSGGRPVRPLPLRHGRGRLSPAARASTARPPRNIIRRSARMAW